ncbi:hypothetical protein CCR75_008906 [Bremia lactucae]|uniref:Uncharacterized protein n=1 Tax=Bremia lactucae TaxID=4779 RepID=A0A976FQJ8_BRELC|nr:hypothetical protein CCR75_008906 [Bremia lactucae]
MDDAATDELMASAVDTPASAAESPTSTMKTTAAPVCDVRARTELPPQDAVWTSSDVNRLKATLSGDAQPDIATQRQEQQKKRPLYDDNDPLAELFVCAVREACLVRDGDQRPMTALEHHTLEEWMCGNIYFRAPPRFVTDTHVRAEQPALVYCIDCSFVLGCTRDFQQALHSPEQHPRGISGLNY